MNFDDVLKEKVAQINCELEKYLGMEYPEIIYEAMQYSVFSQGKRLRPVFLLAVCESLGGEIENALPFACALEMIHTYSLIHDDLPAMDDDDFRRGVSTNHIQFGEGVAILAGDGLLNMAYEIMAEFNVKKNKMNFLKAMSKIAEAAGTRGMVGGQVADILSENKKVDESTLIYIHKNKTAKLIQSGFIAGALAADADEKTVQVFAKAGEKLGMAFQIKDDLLDVTGNMEDLGKPIHSDEKNLKTTYVSIYGLEKAEKIYNEMSIEVIEALKKQKNTEFLVWLSESLINRIK